MKKLEKKILLSLHNEISSSLLNCNLVISKKREIVSKHRRTNKIGNKRNRKQTTIY